MPRKATFPPKLHTHAGRARVKWQGKWHDCGRAGTPEADRKHRRLCLTWANDPTAQILDTTAMSVAELCLAYQRARPYPDGERVQITRAIALLLEVHQDTPVGEFGPLALGAWQRGLADRESTEKVVKGRKEGERSPLYTRSYVAKLVRIVRAIFRWGVSVERIEPGQLQALMTVRGLRPGMAREPREVLPVPDDVLEKVLPFLTAPASRLLRVLRLTGARPSELFGLRPCDLKRSGAVWAYRPARHKTAGRGKGRAVLFGPKAQAVLAECGVEGEAPYFLHRRGTVYNRNSLGLVLKRACKRAGIERFTVYQCRHARATEIRAAYGIEAASSVLGHANLKTTEVYAQADFKLAERVAAETG
jgi:integrase